MADAGLGRGVDCSVFERHCEANRFQDRTTFDGAVLVFMDDLLMQDSEKQHVPARSNAVKRHFCERCGESTIDMEKERCDPVMKLHPRCPMMLTKNTDVPKGEANGTRVTLLGIEAKTGEEPFILKMDCGTRVRAFCANQIDKPLVQHEADDIVPQKFCVRPEEQTFECKIKIGDETVKAEMKGIQCPLMSNSCTTGHKLQELHL